MVESILRKTPYKTGLAKVAVLCSADTFVVNQCLVLRIKFSYENRHLHQARKRCSQLYRLSTQRLNIDMKPKEVLIEAVNKFLKEKLTEKEFVFSDSQLKFTKKLKDGLIGEIGFRAMSFSLSSRKI